MTSAVARARARALDSRIAAGADVGADPLLARRALQLAGGRVRESTACGVLRCVRDAREPAGRALSCVAPVRREEVLQAEPALLAIARRLRGPGPVPPTVVARVRRMLSDPSGLLFADVTPGALRAWARDVLDDLDDGTP